jgi:hypothetical protein
MNRTIVELDKDTQQPIAQAPTVTVADVEASIASDTYFTAADGARAASEGKPGASVLPEYVTYPGSPLSLVTICVLVLKNGHRMVGVNEGPVSAANFNAAMGRDMARKPAVSQIWPLLGYELRTRLDTSI